MVTVEFVMASCKTITNAVNIFDNEKPVAELFCTWTEPETEVSVANDFRNYIRTYLTFDPDGKKDVVTYSSGGITIQQKFFPSMLNVREKAVKWFRNQSKQKSVSFSPVVVTSTAPEKEVKKASVSAQPANSLAPSTSSTSTSSTSTSTVVSSTKSSKQKEKVKLMFKRFKDFILNAFMENLNSQPKEMHKHLLFNITETINNCCKEGISSDKQYSLLHEHAVKNNWSSLKSLLYFLPVLMSDEINLDGLLE
jgi:hypothetical protein